MLQWFCNRWLCLGVTDDCVLVLQMVVYLCYRWLCICVTDDCLIVLQMAFLFRCLSFCVTDGCLFDGRVYAAGETITIPSCLGEMACLGHNNYSPITPL